VWWGLLVLGLAVAVVVAVLRAARFDVDVGILVGLGEMVMLVPVAVFAVWKRRAGLRELGLRAFSVSALPLTAGLLVAAFLFSALYAAVLSYFDLQVQADLAPIVADLSTPWWFVLGAAVVAPLVEEIFFRGFMFAGFRRRHGWVRAAVISSTLFALVHAQWTAFLPIFLLGFILAYLYQRTGSLWPGILFHVVNNAAAVAAIYLFLRSGVEISFASCHLEPRSGERSRAVLLTQSSLGLYWTGLVP
jgi:membrane protease YdiL (CAAX protease family)